MERKRARNQPLSAQIADSLRDDIENNRLKPGDELPSYEDLAKQWDCTSAMVGQAITLLKTTSGLVDSKRGRKARVLAPRPRITRSSDRHQQEKDLVLKTEEERRQAGAAEIDLGIPLKQLEFQASYKQVQAGKWAEDFGIPESDEVLERTYETIDPQRGIRVAWSKSYIPLALLADNAALLDEENEPWPGGTQHQLYTVGIEIDYIDDYVTAVFPSTSDADAWGLRTGVPLLEATRVSIDTENRTVEISVAHYPADLTELKFPTQLNRW